LLPRREVQFSLGFAVEEAAVLGRNIVGLTLNEEAEELVVPDDGYIYELLDPLVPVS